VPIKNGTQCSGCPDQLSKIVNTLARQSVGANMTAELLLGAISACSVFTLAWDPSASALVSAPLRSGRCWYDPSGTVRFVQQADSVRVSGRISGLRPGQDHSFHVHEAADCRGDGMATKGHFNPSGVAHGKQGGQGCSQDEYLACWST
jgi:Cu/Zn superoxide dismutase